MLLWNKVGLESPIITLREMWRITYSVKYEDYNDSRKNYVANYKPNLNNL